MRTRQQSARHQLHIVMVVAGLALMALAALATWLLNSRTGRNGQTTAMSVHQQIGLLLGVTVFLAAIVSAVCVAASRSIRRPLRLLTAAANEAAYSGLPRALAAIGTSTAEVAPASDAAGTPDGVDAADAERPVAQPIVVEGAGELAELAAAFNWVQQAAVGVALDQARSRRNIGQMFVNLGRRNQVLLKRTLAFVSELEQNERDPATLENLFRLDHLVTRMRRNAESLLVLAGDEPSRTWSEPVDIGDVVQAAMSEIEDYTRVQLVLLHPIAVRGTAAANVTHLLSELLENATNYSAPSTRVKITGKPRPDGSYLVSVVDKGIGMTIDELADANRRIREVGAIDQRPLMVQGLYVVGRLAARHGVRVQFGASADEGVLVEVLLPAELLEERPPEPAKPPAAIPQMEMAMALQPALAAHETTPTAPAAAPATAPAAFTEHGLARRVRGMQMFDTGPEAEDAAEGLPVGGESAASVSRFFESVERAHNQARSESTD